MEFFIGVYSLPVIFSYIGLVFSIISCYISFNGNFKIAILFLILAGLIDVLDGKIARKFNKNNFQRKFGVEIDSILDVVSFIMTPIIILFFMEFNEIIDLALFIIYAFCGTMRLAYFNTYAILEENSNIYRGLPVTTIALYLPLIILISNFTANNIWFIRISMLIISILYITNFKIKKPEKLYFPVILGIIAIVIFIGILLYMR